MSRLIAVTELTPNAPAVGTVTYGQGLAKLLNSDRIQNLRTLIGAILTYAIVSLTRTKGVFRLTGDFSAVYATGTIYIAGSTANDGTYTVDNVSYSSPNTSLRVTQALNSATADGNIQYNYVKAIAAVNTGTKTISIAGNVASSIAAVTTRNIIGADVTNDSVSIAGDYEDYVKRVGYISIAGSTGNNGSYTVTNAIYDGTNTVIYTSTAIPSSVADGTVAFEGVIVVTGSTGNNGVYRIVSATFNSPNTDIVVVETVPSATADGNIKYFLVKSVVAVTTSLYQVLVAGDRTDTVDVGSDITITGSTGNNGTYNVTAISYSSPNSTITIDTALPSATADGSINVGNSNSELSYSLEKGAVADKVLEETESVVKALINTANTSNSIVVINVSVEQYESNVYPSAQTMQIRVLDIIDVTTNPANGTGSIIQAWPEGSMGPVQYVVTESKSAVAALANA